MIQQFLMAICLVTSPPQSGAAPNQHGQIPPAIASHDERDIVFFAADSVEFQLPHGWNMQETPWQRDIYLQLGPGSQFPRNPLEGHGGLWIRYRPTRSAANTINLRDQLSMRMQAAIGILPRTGEPINVEIGGFRGLLQEIMIPQAEGASLPGAHLVVLTQWGTFELRATEPSASSHLVSAATTEILQSIQFHSPAPGIGAGQAPQAKALAAAPIFGTWKAINGRMQILHDGRVALEFDRKQLIRFDESGQPKFRQPATVIIGRYEAEFDVIRVTWEDGSQTNYRWDLQDDQLLLTDHDGRVSQLAPVFE